MASNFNNNAIEKHLFQRIFSFAEPKQPKIASLRDSRCELHTTALRPLPNSDFEKVGWVSDSQLFADKTQHLQGRLAAARHLMGSTFRRVRQRWLVVFTLRETEEGRRAFVACAPQKG